MSETSERQDAIQSLLDPATPAHVTASKVEQLMSRGYTIVGLVLTDGSRNCVVDCGKVRWLDAADYEAKP